MDFKFGAGLSVDYIKPEGALQAAAGWLPFRRQDSAPSGGHARGNAGRL